MTQVIHFLQSFSTPVLDSIFLAISALTGETVFVIILGYLYWCRDKNSAYAAGLVMISSFTVNVSMKNIFKFPRPFEYSDVRQIDVKTGYGYSFPSGHSQLSATFSGMCFLLLRNKAILISGIIFTLLTGLSRMYLGVHTLADVITGFGFGLLLILAGDFLLKHMKYKNIVSIVLIVFNLIIVFLTGDSDLYKMSGFSIGFVLGHILDERYIHFDVSGSAGTKAVRFLLGILLTLLVKILISLVIPDKLLQYAAVGFTVTGLVPLIGNIKKTVYKNQKN